MGTWTTRHPLRTQHCGEVTKDCRSCEPAFFYDAYASEAAPAQAVEDSRTCCFFFCVIRITEYHGTTGDNLFLFSCVWSESYLLFLPVVNDANFDFGAASLRYYRTHQTKREKTEGSLLFAVFLLMVISSGPIGSAGRSVLSGCARRHMLSHHMCCPAKERCFCLSVERRLAHDYLERARPGPWAPSPSPPPQELTRSTLHHRGMIASKRGARWALN